MFRLSLWQQKKLRSAENASSAFSHSTGRSSSPSQDKHHHHKQRKVCTSVRSRNEEPLNCWRIHPFTLVSSWVFKCLFRAIRTRVAKKSATRSLPTAWALPWRPALLIRYERADCVADLKICTTRDCQHFPKNNDGVSNFRNPLSICPVI